MLRIKKKTFVSRPKVKKMFFEILLRIILCTKKDNNLTKVFYFAKKKPFTNSRH